MLRLIAALALLSVASGDPTTCQDQFIILNDTHPFIFNRTEMAGSQKCQWNFAFPANMVAEISINGSSMQFSDSVQLYSNFGPVNTQFLEIQGDRNATADKSLHVMWPPSSFEMTIITGGNTSAILAIKVTLHNLYLKSSDVKTYTTGVNQQPQLVQFPYNYGWQPYSRVQATAANNGRVVVSVDNPGPWDYVTYANIFVYSGNSSNLVFLGTLNSLTQYSNHIISPNDTLNLYKSVENYATATLVINDYENLKALGQFDLDWSPKADRNYQGIHQLDATMAPAALTVINEVDGSNAIYLTRVDNADCIACIVTPNYTSPIKVLAGGMVRDYDTQGTLLGSYRDPTLFDDRNYPQYLPGTARTFVLERGMAFIHYTSIQPAEDTEDTNGRTGFLMSDNYPFKVWAQNSKNLTINSMDGSNFTLEYTIPVQSASTYYLNLYTTYNNHTRLDQKDLSKLAPGTYNVTAQGVGLCLVQSFDTINGTLIPYKVYSSFNPVTIGPDTTTTRPVTTSTSPSVTTKAVGTTEKSTTVKPTTTTMTTSGNVSTTIAPTVSNTTPGSMGTTTTMKPATTTPSAGNGSTTIAPTVTNATAGTTGTTTTVKPATTTMPSSGNASTTTIPAVTNATTGTTGTTTTINPVNVTTTSTSPTTSRPPVTTTAKQTTTSSKPTTSTQSKGTISTSPSASSSNTATTTIKPVNVTTTAGSVTTATSPTTSRPPVTTTAKQTTTSSKPTTSTQSKGTISTSPSASSSNTGSPMTTNSPIETSTMMDTTVDHPGNGTIPTNATVPTVPTVPTTTPKAAHSNLVLTAVTASLVFLLV